MHFAEAQMEDVYVCKLNMPSALHRAQQTFSSHDRLIQHTLETGQIMDQDLSFAKLIPQAVAASASNAVIFSTASSIGF
jgi:hypothetical protein